MAREIQGKKYQSLKKADNFYRAELRLSSSDIGYQLKLRELNKNEACFFTKQDAMIFKKLEIGKKLEMKYWTGGKTKAVNCLKAKVKNITKRNQELLNGHYRVYLSLQGEKNWALTEKQF